MRSQVFFVLVAAGLCFPFANRTFLPQDFPRQLPIPYLTPIEQVKTFVLPKGYKLELVLSDPEIREPVAIAFDGDGRMFVAEMRTYMQDIEGSDQRLNRSRVSLHWSSKSDGVFDQHTVFADSLVLPRMILPVKDGLLVNESESHDIWLYQDTDGDGVADTQRRVFEGGPCGLNLEHQPSGLMWNLDNWIYTTINNYRLRFDGTNMVKESIPSNGGQWGMTHDNYGKPWIVNASGEVGPLQFQQPFLYGAFSVEGELVGDYKETWPFLGIADFQAGLSRVRPGTKSLNHLTGACGPEIFRGDRLPRDLQGDLFFAEPVGRLIRRSKIEVRDGQTYLRNAYDKSEFIRSTDLNFRPVNLTTAPDGTLYIVDMYRGVIQEASWLGKSSYLRKVVEQYQLDKNVGRGRIWRLMYEDFQPSEPPRLEHASSAELIRALEHPNGWHRDTAQKLLVLQQDKAIVPGLVALAEKHTNHIARIHAIWTLEGLEALDASLLTRKFRDPIAAVRVAAIRAAESLIRNGDLSLEIEIRSLAQDPDPNVRIQVVLTANRLNWNGAKAFITNVIRQDSSKGVREIGKQATEIAGGQIKTFLPEQEKIMQQGVTVYNQLCFACHGQNGKGAPKDAADHLALIAPSLKGSKRVTGLADPLINLLLKGVTGPIDGKTYDSMMVPLERNEDAWIAAVASYIRNSFGNDASFVTPNDVARVRSAFADRRPPWTTEELAPVSPAFVEGRAAWKVTASHNREWTRYAVDNSLQTRYTTEETQLPEMWMQVELPKETTITGVYLNADASNREYPRGYKVELSSDGADWGKPVSTGAGNAATTEAIFTPQSCRYIRITLTAVATDVSWAVHDLQLLQPADPGKIAEANRQTGNAPALD